MTETPPPPANNGRPAWHWRNEPDAPEDVKAEVRALRESRPQSAEEYEARRAVARRMAADPRFAVHGTLLRGMYPLSYDEYVERCRWLDANRAKWAAHAEPDDDHWDRIKEEQDEVDTRNAQELDARSRGEGGVTT